MCPQCGTRDEEWREEAGGDEEAYIATTTRCLGCEAIAYKQADVPDGRQGYGVKVGLIPAALYAARQAAKALMRNTGTK